MGMRVKLQYTWGMTQGFSHVVYGVIGIVACIAVIVLVIAFAPYLGLTSYLHKGFFIASPDVLVKGVEETLAWSVSDAGITKFPTEKIELCRGESIGMQCVVLANTVPNNRSARVKVPITFPGGSAYIRMTGKDPAGNLVASASSTRPVQVVNSVALTTGQVVAITWKPSTSKASVKIELCTPPNPNSACKVLAQSAKDTGSFQVTIPKGFSRLTGYVIVRNRLLGGLLSGASQYTSVKLVKDIARTSNQSQPSDQGDGGGGGNGGGGSGDGGNPTPTPTLPPPGTASCQGVNVKDFSAKGNGRDDDTTAIRRAAASAMSTHSTLCFPAGRYIISGEISFNGYSAIRSDAGALLEQTCSTCKIFTFVNQYAVSIQHMKFLGGTKQVAVVSSGAQDSTISIVDSDFEGSSDYAISAGNTSGGILPGSLVVDRSKMVKVRKALRNSVASATVRDTWVTITKDNFDANSAAFWNMAGASLTFDNMMGTPSMGAGTSHLANTRWVDNYGAFTAVQSRFGGEDAGIPAVYEFNGGSYNSTSVTIRDSQISCGVDSQPDSGVIVLKDVIPRSIALSGNFFPVRSPYIRAMGINVAQYIASQHPQLSISLDANMAYPSVPDIPAELEPFTHRQIISTP